MIAKKMEDCMPGNEPLHVPSKVDYKLAKNWGDAK